MTKKKAAKPEPKPTPPAADIAGDHSATLARAEPEPDHMTNIVARLGERVGSAIMANYEACPICGRIRTTDVCEVDGHRFEVAK